MKAGSGSNSEIKKEPFYLQTFGKKLWENSCRSEGPWEREGEGTRGVVDAADGGELGIPKGVGAKFQKWRVAEGSSSSAGDWPVT